MFFWLHFILRHPFLLLNIYMVTFPPFFMIVVSSLRCRKLCDLTVFLSHYVYIRTVSSALLNWYRPWFMGCFVRATCTVYSISAQTNEEGIKHHCKYVHWKYHEIVVFLKYFYTGLRVRTTVFMI